MLGLRTTIYKVGDIQKATEWYSKAFETNPYFNEPYYVGFNNQGYELGLQPEENPTLNKIESVVSYWGVENIQETFDRLIELGATENEKPYDVGGEITTISGREFIGNVVETPPYEGAKIKKTLERNFNQILWKSDAQLEKLRTVILNKN